MFEEVFASCVKSYYGIETLVIKCKERITLANNLATIEWLVFFFNLVLYALSGLNYHCNLFVCSIIEQASTVSIEEFHICLLVLRIGLSNMTKKKRIKFFKPIL